MSTITNKDCSLSRYSKSTLKQRPEHYRAEDFLNPKILSNKTLEVESKEETMQASNFEVTNESNSEYAICSIKNDTKFLIESGKSTLWTDPLVSDGTPVVSKQQKNQFSYQKEFKPDL